jgi:fatty-acyl-CoA synthase
MNGPPQQDFLHRVNPPEGNRRAGSIGQACHTSRCASSSSMTPGASCEWRMSTRSNVFAGYLDPQQNVDLWIHIEGSRWLNTGDLGRQDGLGYFWLAGRRKELIIRGGHNIDPKLIEDALSKHPAVAMAAAVGSPDAYAGEVPVAYVQPKPGVPSASRN